MPEEIWKPVIGYEGLYEVSNLGRVKSLPRKTVVKSHIIKVEISWNGRPRVHLSKNGKAKHETLYRLIAMAFIPNPENKPEVNHIDGNPLNNNVSNLEWATKSENCWHRNNVLGVRTGFSKDADKPVICVESGIKYTSIIKAAKDTGAYRQNIAKCIQGKRETAGGYHWKLV